LYTCIIKEIYFFSEFSRINTCSTFQFTHSRAGTKLRTSIKGLSFNSNIVSSRHNELNLKRKRKGEKINMCYGLISKVLIFLKRQLVRFTKVYGKELEELLFFKGCVPMPDDESV